MSIHFLDTIAVVVVESGLSLVSFVRNQLFPAKLFLQKKGHLAATIDSKEQHNGKEKIDKRSDETMGLWTQRVWSFLSSVCSSKRA